SLLGPAKKKNGYQMPEKFSSGFLLKDIFKNNWTLGKPIGQGGFGLIYLANKGENSKNLADAEYVVKIEPKDNGPLFCESHFYVNCAKEDQLKIFKRDKNINHLAIPKFISSGLCTYNEKDYRFLVMDRYSKDLQSFLDDSSSHQINEAGVMYLMRQVLYALEYIHQKGYSHGDIKGANIMLKNDQESFLVDYGLACRFERDNVHQKYQVKPERRHNGTIEYTSLDAHNGAQISRRSDLEILGYCIVHWLSGTLPWMDQLKNPTQVQQSKTKSMDNVKEFVSNTLNVKNVSESVKKFVEFYLNEVKKLEFESEPPYAKIQSKINDTLKSLKYTGADNFGLFSSNKSKSKVLINY
ncbi:serine threonine- kinase VRK1, partial [Brachionus plicatilis]